PRSSEVLRMVIATQPGMRATSWARCPSANDFGCGFQVPLSLGTRSSSRRVGGISMSSSERKASAMLPVLVGMAMGSSQDELRPSCDRDAARVEHSRTRWPRGGALRHPACAARVPRRLLWLLVREAVPDAGLREQDTRPRRVRLELPPELRHVDAQVVAL